jgi:intracellular sulfur oxidation DsrE/DsrF family protein
MLIGGHDRCANFILPKEIAMRFISTVFKSMLAGLFVFGISAGTVLAADAAKKHGVVFHVTDSDPAKWNQALNNAANLQKAIGKDNMDIEIVVNGKGLDMMKFDSVAASRMTEATKNGVKLLACGATMKAANVTEKDLHEGVKVVPGGVVEIMQKQEAGWSYIKI